MKRKEQALRAANVFCVLDDEHTKQQFVRGALWADSEPNWRDVKEELPEHEDRYIVYDGNDQAYATYDPSDKTWWQSEGNALVSIFPTHWMDEPRPPQKGGEK